MEWEYHIQPFAVLDTDDGIEKAEIDLNELGSEGREIFSVLPGMGKGKSWFFAFAKRPASGSE